MPRLELCAVMILAQLADKIKEILNMAYKKEIYWSDSQITLAWINSPLHKSHNRVAEIQRLTKPHQWHHIPSNQNPANLISWGVNPHQLKNNQLWWHGPEIVYKHIEYQHTTIFDIEVPEQKPNTVLTVETNQTFHIFEKYFKLSTLIRVFAYCLRFVNKCKKNVDQLGCLTRDAKSNALTILLRIAPNRSFNSEINNLKKQQFVQRKSNVLKLTPFFDNNNLFRVRGRLKMQR